VNNSNLEKGAPYRFKPGVSGNPGGRPKKRAISDRYLELAEQELPEKYRIKYGLPEGATFGDALAVVMFEAALAGKAEAAREIREAIEGKTAQRQETIDPESRDVNVQVINSRRAVDFCLGGYSLHRVGCFRGCPWFPQVHHFARLGSNTRPSSSTG
jgi:hypothetical protein